MSVRPKMIIIIGVVLLILSIIGAIISYNVILQDPGEIYEEKVILKSEDGYYSNETLSKVIQLKKGEYDIWYEPDYEFLGIVGSPRDITIKDSNDDLVFTKSTLFGSSEAYIKKGEKKYNRYGTFEIESSGDYLVSVEGTCTLYITPHIDVELGNGLGLTCIIISIIGTIIIVVGLVFLYLKKRKPKKASSLKGAPPQQYYQYPTYPGYPSPPPGYGPPPERKASDRERTDTSATETGHKEYRERNPEPATQPLGNKPQAPYGQYYPYDPYYSYYYYYKR